MMTRTFSFITAAFIAAAPSAFAVAQPDVTSIIQQSVAAVEADWKAAPEYDYFEQDRDSGGSKTYHVLMVDGSPYQELVAIDGQPLSMQEQQREQQKLQQTISERQSESPSDRAQRVAKYERDRDRDHLLTQQLTQAFDFRLVGQRRLDSRSVYLLDATPRPDYRPPNTEAEVLTGMQGKLWIDSQTYQWVKVEATVVHPVSIAGFLARVEPGTHFELEKMPVADGIWLPKHFEMRSSSKIFFLFHHRTQANETYSKYQRSAGHGQQATLQQ